MGPSDGIGLKGDLPVSDTPEVKTFARRSTKCLVLGVVVLALGAAVAGASALGVQIDSPLAFERGQDGAAVQVLPAVPPASIPAVPPVTVPPVAGTLTDAARTTLLQAVAPGTAHEAIPHGVPAGYDWRNRSTSTGARPPAPSSDYVNLWGQVYVGAANVRPANTRVAISGCELWQLPASGTWTRVQGGPTSRIEGGAWSEDFTRSGGPFSLRDEADGSQSTVTADGYNSHFWTRDGLVDLGSTSQAVAVACSTRLVLADPGGVDDRASSSYLVSVGADWRESDYGCPRVGAVDVCSALGTGRMIRATNAWRRVVFTTSDLSGLTTPLPAEALRNPDGTFGA